MSSGIYDTEGILLPIVEHLNIFKDINSSFTPSPIAFSLNQLLYVLPVDPPHPFSCIMRGNVDEGAAPPTQD